MVKEKCPHCGGTGVKIDAQEMLTRRMNNDLTLREVSEKMGISIQYLSELERGKKNWSPKLAEAFNKAVGK